MLGIGNGGVRNKFEVWNRERSSSQIPKLGNGNGGVRVKFEAWNRKWRSSSQVPTLGIGNGRVRAKFNAWNREWRCLSAVRGLESEMEEFEPSSKLGIGNRGVRVKF